MSDAVKVRLYETNLLLARELRADDQLTLQLYPHYPNVDFAVRALFDKHYKGTVMPMDTVAFGTDVLGYLPPEVAKVLAPDLRRVESEGKGDLGIGHIGCRFVEVDRWGAALVVLDGPGGIAMAAHAGPIEDQMGLLVEDDMTG